MIQAICDRCKQTIGGPSDIASRPIGAFGAHTVLPGVVGEKHLCGECWAVWRRHVMAFFRVGGQ